MAGVVMSAGTVTRGPVVSTTRTWKARGAGVARGIGGAAGDERVTQREGATRDRQAGRGEDAVDIVGGGGAVGHDGTGRAGGLGGHVAGHDDHRVGGVGRARGRDGHVEGRRAGVARGVVDAAGDGVSPMAKVLPEAGTQTGTRLPSTRSLALALKLTGAPEGPVAGVVMSAGTVTTGPVVSTTRTWKAAEPVLLAASVALQVTSVSPRGKVPPETGRQVGVRTPSTSSEAEAL